MSDYDELLEEEMERLFNLAILRAFVKPGSPNE